jgi:hypothetical protein
VRIGANNGVDNTLQVQGASRRLSVLTNMLLRVKFEPASF